MTTRRPRAPARADDPRERALKGAADLFYAEGINATGVKRIAEVLGISKRTLYELFGSKDALVADALALRDAPVRSAFTGGAEAASDEGAEQLLALFEVVERWRARPDFRGCPFLNASVELADVGHPARRVTARHKEALRVWMERAARRAGLHRPRQLSQHLMIVLDGVLAHAAAVPDVPAVAVDMARILIAAAR